MRKIIVAAAAIAALLSIGMPAQKAAAMTVASPAALGVTDLSPVQHVHWGRYHRHWASHHHGYWAWHGHRRYWGRHHDHYWGWRHYYWAGPWLRPCWRPGWDWHPWWGWYRPGCGW